jgi:hypothetical protein
MYNKAANNIALAEGTLQSEKLAGQVHDILNVATDWSKRFPLDEHTPLNYQEAWMYYKPLVTSVSNPKQDLVITERGLAWETDRIVTALMIMADEDIPDAFVPLSFEKLESIARDRLGDGKAVTLTDRHKNSVEFTREDFIYVFYSRPSMQYTIPNKLTAVPFDKDNLIAFVWNIVVDRVWKASYLVGHKFFGMPQDNRGVVMIKTNQIISALSIYEYYFKNTQGIGGLSYAASLVATALTFGFDASAGCDCPVLNDGTYALRKYIQFEEYEGLPVVMQRFLTMMRILHEQSLEIKGRSKIGKGLSGIKQGLYTKTADEGTGTYKQRHFWRKLFSTLPFVVDLLGISSVTVLMTNLFALSFNSAYLLIIGTSFAWLPTLIFLGLSALLWNKWLNRLFVRTLFLSALLLSFPLSLLFRKNPLSRTPLSVRLKKGTKMRSGLKVAKGW